MAKISAITMRNFKGTTGTQELTGADVFIGNNGAGKSTRLQALQTAMLGYVPGNGKPLGDTFNKFSSDPASMAAGLSLDGFSFQRQINRAAKSGGSVKFSESFSISPARIEKTETDKKGRIASEVGTFATMLDFSEFTSLTDNKRRDFIYSLSGAGQSDAWNKEKIRTYLDTHLQTMELEINDPDLFAVLGDLIAEAVSKYEDDMNLDDGLAAIREYVQAELSVWKRKAKDAEGTTRQLTEQKNKLGATDREIDANKADLKQKRDQLLEVEAQIARDTERKKAIDRRVARLADLDQLITSLKDSPQPHLSPIADEIDQLQAQMDHTSDQEEYDALSAQKSEAEKKRASFNQTIGSLRQEGAKLDAEIAGFQQTLDTIQKHQGVCVIQHQISCNKDFGDYVAHAENEVAKRRHKCHEINAGIEEAEEASLGLINSIREIEQKMSEIMRRTQSRQKANADRSKRIQELSNKKSSILAAEQKRLDDLTRAHQEREELQNQPVEAIAPLDLLTTRRDALRGEIEALATKVEEQEKARNNMQQIRQALLSNRESEHKAKAFKMIDDALGPKGIQGEIVKTMLEPMREDIERNLWTLGVHRTVFFQTESDTGQEIFQFGWEHNGQRRNYDGLSTGQQLMFLIAFLVAVIDRANPPVKVLAIDNIEHLDEHNQRAILEGLHAMRDQLDNIILAGVIAPQIAKETGWMVHELARDEEMAVAAEGSGGDELGF